VGEAVNDPWAFGWTQLLTLIGYAITIVIAIGGFKSFSRWRREQLEAKRIDVAIEALTVAYKTKFVFEHIRGAMASGNEWDDMPKLPDDTDDKRQRRGAFYAAAKRIHLNKEYFDGLWQLQPKFMAVFGPQTESTFVKVHKARRNIEVAAQMLYEQALETDRHVSDEDTRKMYKELRGHLWAPIAKHGGGEDEVGKFLEEFQREIEAICLPLLAEFRKHAPKYNSLGL
jgi:hypothetical protein